MHPRVCLKDFVAWMTSEGDSRYKSPFFDASVLSQSISHLISALSRVDAADVVSGAYCRQDRGFCPDLINHSFISLSSFVFRSVQRKKELLAYFNHGCLSLMSCFNPQQRTQLAFQRDKKMY